MGPLLIMDQTPTTYCMDTEVEEPLEKFTKQQTAIETRELIKLQPSQRERHRRCRERDCKTRIISE